MSLEDVYAELETHQEWLNSKGTLGLKANFKGIDLSGCNLKKLGIALSDLHQLFYKIIIWIISRHIYQRHQFYLLFG